MNIDREELSDYKELKMSLDDKPSLHYDLQKKTHALTTIQWRTTNLGLREFSEKSRKRRNHLHCLQGPGCHDDRQGKAGHKLVGIGDFVDLSRSPITTYFR